MGRWKFQVRGDEVRAFKLSFFPSLSVSFPEKKNSYSSAYPWESFTFFDIVQKPKRELTSLPAPPCPSDTGRCLFLSPTHMHTHTHPRVVGFLEVASPSGSVWRGQCHDLWSPSERALWWPLLPRDLPQVLAGPCVSSALDISQGRTEERRRWSHFALLLLWRPTKF